MAQCLCKCSHNRDNNQGLYVDRRTRHSSTACLNSSIRYGLLTCYIASLPAIGTEHSSMRFEQQVPCDVLCLFEQKLWPRKSAKLSRWASTVSDDAISATNRINGDRDMVMTLLKAKSLKVCELLLWLGTPKKCRFDVSICWIYKFKSLICALNLIWLEKYSNDQRCVLRALSQVTHWFTVLIFALCELTMIFLFCSVAHPPNSLLSESEIGVVQKLSYERF